MMFQEKKRKVFSHNDEKFNYIGVNQIVLSIVHYVYVVKWVRDKYHIE